MTLTDTWIDEAIARLNAIPFFNDIIIERADKGNLVQELANKLAAMTPKNGKIGACVVVEQLDYTGEMPNLPIAEKRPDFVFVVLEEPLFNRVAYNPSGTGKTVGMIEDQLIAAFHHFACDGIHDHLIFAGSSATDVSAISTSAQGRRIRFTGRLADRQPQFKCNQPVITATNAAVPATVTITPQTDYYPENESLGGHRQEAPAPSIYYTLDLTPPYRGAASAILYTGPFELPADRGAIAVRAVAQRDGWLPSNVVRKDFSVNVLSTEQGEVIGEEGLPGITVD